MVPLQQQLAVLKGIIQRHIDQNPDDYKVSTWLPPHTWGLLTGMMNDCTLVSAAQILRHHITIILAQWQGSEGRLCINSWHAGADHGVLHHCSLHRLLLRAVEQNGRTSA